MDACGGRLFRIGGNVSEKQGAFNPFDMVRVIGLRTAWEAFLFSRKKRRQDARFLAPAAPAGPWQTLGAVRAYHPDEQGVVFDSDSGSLRVDLLAEDCYRVRVSPSGEFGDLFSYALAKTEWEPVPFTTTDDSEAVTIQAGDMRCRIEWATLRLSVVTAAGRVICEDAGGPAWRGTQVRLSQRLASDESGHGLGERAFGLNLRGRTYGLWNTDPAGYARGVDPINFCIPFYVGLRSLSAHGIFWDNPSRGTVGVGAAGAEDELVFSSEAGELVYYVFAGPTALQVLERYTELTGRMSLLPLWVLGYHQARWSYLSAEEVRGIAREFRRRHIPCDALYLDIDYMDGFRCFTWHPELFPEPARLTADLAADGFKTVVILDPGIKTDPRYEVCRSGLEQDVFLKYPDGERFIAPVWPGNCYFPDFTSPAVREWWGAFYAGMLEAGVDGFWNDMGEPAIFAVDDQTKHAPDYLVHDWEGRGATHLEAHNVYGMLMARASREGLEQLAPDRRHLLIIRAGYAGAQRYATSWTADNLSQWDHLRLSISMCLNKGLSGMAFTGPDIGGFGLDGNGELFVRWVQLGALLPFFRGHTAKGTHPNEPWAYGQPYEDLVRPYIELRYRLLPYIYTMVAQCARFGWPIVRPLALLASSFADCDDQYLLGDALLAAPVVEQGAAARTVRFPPGDWFDYWTGDHFAGGASAEVAAPLDALPLYVRAGSVLPHWPVMMHTGERPVTTLELRIYAGSGQTPLYEDAGKGKAYQDGEYRWSTFTCDIAEDGTFTVQWERSGSYRPAYTAVDVSLIGLEARPSAAKLDGNLVADWQVDDGILRLSVGEFQTLTVNP